MNLPNLFLADLGPELELSAQTVREACFALRRNRELWLRQQRTRTLVELISYVGDQWRDTANHFRTQALKAAPELGLGATTLARGLDLWLAGLTPETLEALIVQDLGDPKRLDGFVSSSPEHRTGRQSHAHGPELLAHFCAGNLPVPALMSLVLGVLTKSAQFFQVPAAGGIVPRLFAHSLAQVEPKLGACLEFASWPRTRVDLSDVLLNEAGCVTVTGRDERVAALRARTPERTRFLAYGHRISFSYIAHDVLTIYGLKRLATEAATDVVTWNQLGCLSPHVIYVQENGVISPEGFAVALAEQLATREQSEPQGPLPAAAAAAIHSARTVYEMRRAGASIAFDRAREESAFFEPATTIQLWRSEESTAWTVVLDTDPAFKTSCLNRFIYVKPIKRFADVLRFAEPVRAHLSTVALAVPDDVAPALAMELAHWGATRICRVGQMQAPALPWRHDGRPALGDLVTWTDWEE